MASGSPLNDDIFALIIGIDKYIKRDGLPHLKGAVNDAKAFRQYLIDPDNEKGLQVHPDNIFCLEDEEATRTNILAAFRSHFLHNKKIPDHGGATMIFFYAGHGVRVASKGNANLIAMDGRVEAICPVDERTMTRMGEYVHAIPDYVLGWLLWELSEKKGGNITVILDCCHSGGMGRDANSQARAPTTESRPIPPELDSHLWNRKPTAQHYRMWSPAATSHVLLAACCQGEEAKELEVDGVHYGRFTYHLLAVLRRLSFATTTYAELSEQIRIRLPRGQTAHCGGSRRHRLVFHGGYPSTGRYSVPLVPCTVADCSTSRVSPPSKNSNSSKTFLIEMGAVEGVVEGTEFSAYAPDNSFLCTFVAQSVEVAQTILVPKTRPKELIIIPRGTRVKVSDWKNKSMIMRVHATTNFLYTGDLFRKTETRRARNFEPATSLEEAHIIIRGDGTNIVIERRTSLMLQCPRTTRFSLKSNPTHLPDIMDGIAHFNYFLEHSNSAENTLKDKFTLEMHCLEGQYPHRQRQENMIKDNEGLYKALFTSKVGAKYGFTIRNTSPENVFPYLFYFDPEDYTIRRLYGPAGAHVEAPLSRDGELTIGIGSERGFQFVLSSGDSTASGFLKLFVAREYIDLDIEQRVSPFSQGFGGARGLTVTQEEIPIWDALMVFVKMTAQ